MSPRRPASLLRIHVSESDRFDGKPLYEAIVAKCREMKIAGATVFRGLEGYGETGELRRAPMVVVIVDTAENLAELEPALEAMMHTGMIARSGVEMIRVQKTH
jgi:PII-like signaling protein